ncbi:MAG TPA: GNAT family N-acetyltransferase [Chitinophagaceae bacterium]|jgi:GNAT superfamily N-acetyltransferase|nr:GNAT family N-acetyltransferase [Chitinophagaceae bacterium]
MMRIVRTDSTNPDFIDLVQHLDADLAERDGEDHSFYAKFNTVDKLKNVILVYEGNKPAGCGAMKQFAPGVMEIKRMYTPVESRGHGIATRVLEELEIWAKELEYEKCVLETGKRQPEAIALYRKNGYRSIPNYGQYAQMENSLCFQKELTAFMPNTTLP